MFANSTVSQMESLFVWTVVTALVWRLSQSTILKARPLPADPSLQHPGCESVEDYYY
jgi:hypothetical protein